MADSNPNTPAIVPSTSTNDILAARPDIILFNDETTPIEVMTDLIFENIGGQELINIARTDLVNGQNVVYQPIKNLTSLYLQYNPQNILGLQDVDKDYFKKFPIILSNKIPACGTGPNCEIVYIDSATGDLVINVINLMPDEQVEVEIFKNGEILSDTIYEVNN